MSLLTQNVQKYLIAKQKKALGGCTVHGMTFIFYVFDLRHGDTENEELQAAV